MYRRTIQPRKLQVVQINLHHCEAASEDLVQYLTKKDVDVALIQEPWLYRDKIRGLGTKNYELFYSRVEGKKRACIVAKKSLHFILLSQYSTSDLTVVAWEQKGKTQLLLASAYMPYEEKEPPPKAVRDLVQGAGAHGKHLVIGCDANGHHTQWGSKDINERGESILDFILTTDLNICNRGEVPTFANKKTETVIDLTLATNAEGLAIQNWRVTPEYAFSDHGRISFTINREPQVGKPFRNPRKTDWTGFVGIVGEKVREARTKWNSRPAQLSVKDLEETVNTLSTILVKAFKKSCPVSRARKETKPWWNAELRQKKEGTRRLYNIAKASKGDENQWQAYKASFGDYKKEIKRNKMKSRQEFMESIMDTSETARLRKMLSKDPIVHGSIMKPDGTWTESSSETLEVLMETHFPGCKDIEAQQPERQRTTIPKQNGELIEKVVTGERVTWAVNSFDPYKSSGPDDITPVMLQMALGEILETLVEIFSNCLRLGHVPERWREVRVVFIPKSGKPSNTKPKDFRPISLSSFLQKTLERLLDQYVKEDTEMRKLCIAQHAYLKGRSVESALHEVVGTVERSLKEKEYTLGAFLDIEGAFNNVKTESIREALEDHKVDEIISSWLIGMLESRQISSEVGEIKTKKRTTRGTPQGGVISPLLWLMVISRILRKLRNKGVRIVAYADDVAVLVTGKDLQTISDLMKAYLREITEWAEENGLGVNPEKTVLVLFTRRYKIPSFRPPKVRGQTLTLSQEAKYLGVILDAKLSWKRNVEERMKKGVNAFYICRKMFGRKWGLQPKLIHWLYTAVVRPIITYGALVWWEAMNKRTYVGRLAKVQRLAAIGTTGAQRSTPQAALDVLLNLLPLDLYIKGLAAKSALRLRETGLWKQSKYGHTVILEAMGELADKESRGVLNQHTDYITAKLRFEGDLDILIPTREDWEKNPSLESNSIFTDGSVMDERVGAGVYSETLELRESLKLKRGCNILQAELKAIKRAAELVRGTDETMRDITIYTDSQAALRTLSSTTVRSKLVMSCREALSWIRDRKVRLCWVPGHSNVKGNQAADDLARLGAGKDGEETEDSPLPPIKLLRDTIDRILEGEQDKRWSNRDDCVTSRFLWPQLQKKKTAEMLDYGKAAIQKIVAVITGHCTVGSRLMKMGKRTDELCTECNEEEETIEHLMCYCPALVPKRIQCMGSETLECLGEAADLDIRNLHQFVSSWKCLRGKRNLSQEIKRG